MISKHRKAALIWTNVSVKKVGSVSAICSASVIEKELY